MPLTQDQEDFEHELRTEEMVANIEKLRADVVKSRAETDKTRIDTERSRVDIEKVRADVEKVRADIRADQKRLTHSTWSIFLQALGLVVGAFAAGAAYVKFFH